MNYNIRLTVISINCKNCPIGCPYNLFLRFPSLRVGAGFSSLAFSVAPTETLIGVLIVHVAGDLRTSKRHHVLRQ